MSFVKFLRETASSLPSTVKDGFFHIIKATGETYADIGTTRVRLNPPSNWSETNTSSPAYIANKPTTLSGYGITNAYTKQEVDNKFTNINQNSTISDILDKIEPEKSEEKASTGDTANVTTNTGQLVDEFIVDFEPIQDLHGYDGAWQGELGKNLFNITELPQNYTRKGITVTTDSEGVVTLNGTVESPEFIYPTGDNGDVPVSPHLKASTAYIFTINNTDSRLILEVYYKETASSTYVRLGRSSNGVLSFTTPATFAVLQARILVATDVTLSNVKIYPMIRLASVTDSTFSPYSNISPITGYDSISVQIKQNTLSKLLTIPLPEYSYGGTLNITTGELTINQKYLPISALPLSYSNGIFTTVTSVGAKTNILCDAYQISTSATAPADYTVSVVDGVIKIRDTRYNTVSALNSAMGNYHVCYELQTPVKYQLTPQQVELFKGANQITTGGNSTFEMKVRTGDLATLGDVLNYNPYYIAVNPLTGNMALYYRDNE